MTAIEKASSGSSKVEGRAALRGAEKGLLFLMSLDESVATPILARLTPDEIVELRRATQTLTEVDASVIARIHHEFASLASQGVPASLKGSGAYLRRLAGKVLGEGRVLELWDDRPEPEGALARLAQIDASTMLALLEEEKPQTAAVLLTQLDGARVAEIIGRMSPEMQTDILLRMARLDSVPESLVAEIREHFAAEVESLGREKQARIGGVDAVAAVLKRLTTEQSDTLLQSFAEVDEKAASQVRRNLFTFEDLLRIDDRGIQMLLKEVATDRLVMALKTASENVKEKILGNVSQRVAAMLREELGLLGPVRVADVEEAQQEVCIVALRLAGEGKISVAREGGGDYV